jgi:hypothetical protein
VAAGKARATLALWPFAQPVTSGYCEEIAIF